MVSVGTSICSTKRRQAEARGLALDRVADLVLETGISVDDVPAGHVVTFDALRLEPCRRQAEQEFDQRREEGVDAEEEDREQLVMIITMIAVATVSLRVGQWTFAVSART